MTITLFDSYRQGLAALIAALGPGHPQLDLAYVYQQRLTENLAHTAYGDTESLQAARREEQGIRCEWGKLGGRASSCVAVIFERRAPHGTGGIPLDVKKKPGGHA